MVGGEFVDDFEAAHDVGRGVYHHRHHRNLPAELDQCVAARGMIAVKTADSAERGRPIGGARFPQPPYQCPVDGHAIVAGGFGSVHDELLPAGPIGRPGRGARGPRLGEQYSVAFAQLDSLDR